MAFLVTARKWRPQKFADVVGQEHITRTLENAIKSGRINHSFLFSGCRGVGKTTTARILARALNCTNLSPEGEPCNECDSCRAILDGRSMDVIEIDGASNNSVEDIRLLRENAKYPPTSGKFKVYIIDEVSMLSTSAFNALLKILEEPPAHLIFIFATTEPQKVLPTILSRCQRFEFRRMEIGDIVGRLREISAAEGVKIDDRSLVTIAKKGDGSMRDSQSIYDQVVAFCGNDIAYTQLADALHLVDIDFYFRITDDILGRNFNDIFILTKEILDKGYDFRNVLQGLAEHFRNILAVKTTGNKAVVEVSDDDFSRYQKTGAEFSVPDFVRFLTICGKADAEMRLAAQPRIKFETTLLQLASIGRTLEISDLLREIEEVRKLASAGQVAITEEHRIVEIPTPGKIAVQVPQISVPQQNSAPKQNYSHSEPEESVPQTKPLVVDWQSEKTPKPQTESRHAAQEPENNSEKSDVERKITELFNAYKIN